MYKRIFVLLFIGLFTLSGSVYADAVNVKVDKEFDIIEEYSELEIENEMIAKGLSGKSANAKRSSSTKLEFTSYSRVTGSPDSVRITATLYVRSAGSYVYTGNSKSVTRVRPSGSVSYSSSFGVSSGKTYKVKVTFTETKNGSETKASVWSNAA